MDRSYRYSDREWPRCQKCCFKGVPRRNFNKKTHNLKGNPRKLCKELCVERKFVPEVATGIDVVDAIPSQLCTGKRYMLEANFTNTTGITSYDWVLPAGWRGPNNTNAFTTTSFITNITTSSSPVSGTIQVRARNSCGLGEPFQLNVASIRCTD